MREGSDSTMRYEWALEAHDADRGALYTGTESDEVLASLFAMWLQDRGDVSSWSYAPQLGKVVHTYSALSLPVIAVWLGIPTEEIVTADVPGTPPWTFDGPDGYHYKLSRTLTVETDH